MVEVLVTSVLKKLEDYTVSVFKQIGGVEAQIEKVGRELKRIQAFLKDADRKTIRDETQKNWVREVMEVAYDIEDVIDNAILLGIPQETTSKRKVFVKMFKKPHKLPAIYNLGDQLNKILERIDDISNSRVKYGIKDLNEVSGGDFTLPLKPVMLPEIDDPNIVGFDTHKDNIINMLLDENTQRRSVVSIVGVGGLGKTTLARKVYNSVDVKTNFNLRIWVTVSRKFQLIDILRNMLEQIGENYSGEQGKDIVYFLNKLHKSLGDKKYLLILDDVWAEELWSHIDEALIDANNGSRVLITSRNENVAKFADPSLEPYKPLVLSEEQSLQVLLKKACYDPNPSTAADSHDLIDVAKQLAKKCGGLPLALSVLGGQLRKKPCKYTTWSKLLQTMSWRTDGSQCTKILATSYDDLPLALKFCFMYFAAFPEDYEIEAGELTRMWIAEGFISPEENETLEDTAERYLEDLVQRSLCMVITENIYQFYDPMKFCRVHDLLRDLAIEKAKENNFLTVCSKPNENPRCGEARRVAVHHSDIDGLVNHASSNLRSLLCFNSSHLPNCSGHKLLKVLRVVCDRGNEITIRGDENISSQLRYLQLEIICKIHNPSQFCKWINSMKLLQTLQIDFRGEDLLSDLDHLSDFAWEIETLRYVNLPSFSFGPPPGANLRNLKTIFSAIQNRESLKITALPNMPNLCYLVLALSEGSTWEIVVSFLHTLKSLVRLKLFGDSVPTEVTDMRDFPFYQQLKYLTICDLNIRKGEIDAAMFPTHLTVLDLEIVVMQEDPMTLLEKLHYLEKLRLNVGRGEDVKQIRCSEGGFLRLRTMIFRCCSMNLDKWEIEEGAMPMLKELVVEDVILQQVPLGLKHLIKLAKLRWCYSYQDPSATALEDEIRNLCGHVAQLEIF